MIHSYNKLPDVLGGHKSNISLKFEWLTTLHLETVIRFSGTTVRESLFCSDVRPTCEMETALSRR